MTQHGLLHSELTMASQSYAQHSGSPDVIPNLNSNTNLSSNSKLISDSRASHKFSPLEQLLLHHNSTSPTSSQDVPQNHAEASDTDLTPPTSSSGLSSQERTIFSGQAHPISASDEPNPDAVDVLMTKSTAKSPRGAGSLLQTSAAPKRTSSGQIKRSSISGRDGPESTFRVTPGRSRTSSLLSNGSSVTELSQQLRTRLSYAMVKVQNGWESNSLEEIESLTSKHTPSRSQNTMTAFGYTAPSVPSSRTAMTPCLRRQGSSNLSSEGVPAPSRSSPLDSRAPASTNHRQGPINQPQKRALAPPADIVPGPRRRPHHANLPPNGYRNVNPSSRPTGSKQRTASQSAAMEADAVETLLFMASPGNSSHHPSNSRDIMGPSASTSSQPSPLAPDFPNHDHLLLPLPSPQRRVAFTDLPRTIPSTITVSSRFEEIDRLIDEMDDASTDDGVGLDLLLSGNKLNFTTAGGLKARRI